MPRKHDDPWSIREEYFDHRPVRATGRAMFGVWGLALLALGMVLVTVVALWLAGVFTSDVRGQGEAVKQKNEAANRIRQQEGFEQLFADIQSADRVIVITKQTIDSGQAGPNTQTEYLGQQQYCTGLVGDYNAKARKFTAADFRSADLPAQIDMTDATTDCKG